MRCGDAPRPCGRARQTTAEDEKVRKVPDSGEDQARESRKARFVEQQGAERLSALTHAKISCGREWFHAASVTRPGGERSWISTAVSLSMTCIGPPHFGQNQRSLESLLPARSCSVCGADPSKRKQSGRGLARRRLAKKPKFRMPTKPWGSTCNRKRRRNSSRKSQQLLLVVASGVAST